MQDHRKFDLRELTEKIYYIREFLLKRKFPFSRRRTDVTELYEELWKKRDELEDEIFGNK